MCGKRKLVEEKSEDGERSVLDAEAEPKSKRVCGASMLGDVIVVRSGIGKKERANLEAQGYMFVNVTSNARKPQKLGGNPDSEFYQLSPFFPVGGVPLPEDVVCEYEFSESVEGLWQGLKIIDGKTEFKKFGNRRMKDLKRSTRKKVMSGHFVGEGKPALNYEQARKQIYVPAYVAQLEKMGAVVERLRDLARQRRVALVDYTTAEWNDLSKPLSHAGLLRHVLLGETPWDVKP